MKNDTTIRRTVRTSIHGMCTPSTKRFLALAAADWSVIAAAAWSVNHWQNLPVLIASVLVIGSRQHALQILGHDGTHYLASSHRGWNERLTKWLCLWPFGVSLAGYRSFHFAHHRQAGTQLDPERPLKTGRLYDASGLPRDLALRFLASLMALGLGRLLRLIRVVRPPTAREALGLATFHVIGFGLLAALGQLWVEALWWGSFLTAGWAAFSVREWSEHTGIEGTHRVQVPTLVRWMCYPHSSSHHYEHHKYPWIPCWRLGEVRLIDQSEPVVALSTLLDRHLRGGFISSAPIPTRVHPADNLRTPAR